MENSWFGPTDTVAAPNYDLSVHDSANSFGGRGGKHPYRKAFSQGTTPTSSQKTVRHSPPSRQMRQSYSSPHSPDQVAQPSGASGQDLNSARPRQDNAAVPKLEPMGTWAHRQIRFPWPRKTAQLFDSAGSHSDAVAAESGSPSAVSNPTKIPGSPIVGSHPQPPPAASQKPPPAPRRVSIDEDDAKVCEAAWRWRFGRRWVQEQSKQFDPQQADDAEEEWDDALGYLDACGPGFNLIARTSSEFAEPRLNRTQSLLSQESGGSKSLNSLLMDDYSLKETALGEAVRQEKTQEKDQGVVALAKKAQDLYKQQQEIIKKADQKWEGAAQQGNAWLGQALDPVRIDTLGKFTFVLVKLENRQGSSRLLVRGWQGCSQAALMQAVEKEMAGKVAAKRLPSASLRLLGSGNMEWRGDKQIDVSQGVLIVQKDSHIKSKADVAHVAGALIRATLPMHYHITVNGTRI